MPYLFIDVQHGLCNRLRALVSAAVIAKRTDRELVVIWRKDHHCAGRISDILRYDGLVIEDDRADLIRHNAARTYNYLEVEEGAQRGALIDPSDVHGDVYIRSAETLNSPFADEVSETRLLRRLVPSTAVLDLIETVRHPSDVALHIRMGTGPAFDHLSYESPDNWPAERHRELTYWREKSDLSRFVARLDVLLEAKPDSTLFLAADLPGSYAAMIDRYGDRVRFLSRELYDRSARQLQFALADLMLLAAAPLFLASTWSSFSDVAQRLARPGRRVEQSGVDF